MAPIVKGLLMQFCLKGEPLHSIIPAQGEWHNPKVNKYEYSQEKARELFKAIGLRWNSEGQLLDAFGNQVSFNLYWLKVPVTIKSESLLLKT